MRKEIPEMDRYKRGWKVVSGLGGSYYSCFVGNINPSAVKAYSYSRWTRRGHNDGPLAVFATVGEAQAFMMANMRDVALESWVLVPCIYLPELYKRSLGMLWYGKSRTTRKLPAGTRMAKAVLLVIKEDEDAKRDSGD